MRSAAATPEKRRRGLPFVFSFSSSPSSRSSSFRCALTLLTVKWLAKGESRLEATPVCCSSFRRREGGGERERERERRGQKKSKRTREEKLEGGEKKSIPLTANGTWLWSAKLVIISS